MKWRTSGVLGVVATVVVSLISAGRAEASASGSQSFEGIIVTSGSSGSRVVLSSPVVASGVFRGVGRIVEVENLPSDPDDVSRDDLVFPQGRMHLVSTTVDFSFSVDPRSCVFTATLQQTGAVVGGTGRFTAATGSSTATVTARGLLARNADRSCSQERVPLVEVDTITSSGSLSI